MFRVAVRCTIAVQSALLTARRLQWAIVLEAPEQRLASDGRTLGGFFRSAGLLPLRQKDYEGESAMSEERLSGGQLAAAISNAVVRRIADVSGRGPSRARTTIGHDSVFVVVEDTLTVGERELVGIGDAALVLRMREGLQRAMRQSLDRDIEGLTGRKVIGFMSTNQIDPDLGVEVFILAPEAESRSRAEAPVVEAEVG